MSLETVFYKTVRPDGYDLHSGTVNYHAAHLNGGLIQHPTSQQIDPQDHSTFLSFATTPTAALGNLFKYPYRLYAVSLVGPVVPADGVNNWVCALAARVLEERPAYLAFGDNGLRVFGLFHEVNRLNTGTLERLVEHHRSLEPVDLEAVLVAAEDTELGIAAYAGAYFIQHWVSTHWRFADENLRQAAYTAIGGAAVVIILGELLRPTDRERLTASWRAVCGDRLLSAAILTPEATERIEEGKRRLNAINAKIDRLDAGIAKAMSLLKS